MEKTCTRQEVCATLQISESTLYRLELQGMPFLQVGKRAKRYELDAVKEWLQRSRPCPSGSTLKAEEMSQFRSMADEYIESFQPRRLRVMPSNSRRNSEPS